MVYPFEHPEAQKVFSALLIGLTNESHRGAVLVGTAHVDRLLELLFEVAFPSAFNKKAREHLLRYPGPLSSLAAKTEVAYALRLIPRSAYEALHALRKLRNDVAHSPDAFELKDHENRYRAVHAALGENMDVGINRMALEMLVRYKLHVIQEVIKEHSAEHPGDEPVVTSEVEALELIQGNDDIMAALQRQLPLWELSIGIAALCSVLIIFREQAADIYRHDGTVSQVLKAFQANLTSQDVPAPGERRS
jgi:DNA-binding MltR family transcriptional regulator